MRLIVLRWALACFNRGRGVHHFFISFANQNTAQLSKTRITLSPRRNILLMNRSLFTTRPFLPSAVRGVSLHISFTFSRTILQWRSNALTLPSSLRLFRHEMRTCVCCRTAVWRRERGPDVNSCVSRTEISYSLALLLAVGWGRRGRSCAYVSSARGFARSSLQSQVSQRYLHSAHVVSPYWIFASDAPDAMTAVEMWS